MSFFKQLDQLLPARANKLTGLLIQPNLLERNKQSILATVQRDHQELDFKITSSVQLSKDSYYASITGSINTNDDLVNGNIINNQTASIIILPPILDSAVINNDVTSSIVYTRIITAIAENNNATGSITLSSNRILADNNIVLDFYLTGSNATRYNGTNYLSNLGVFDVVSDTTATEFVKRIQTFESGSKTYISSSAAASAGFYPRGYSNARYNGTKLTAAGFNINSPDTIGNVPVVEIKAVISNQININPTIFPEPTVIDPWFLNVPFEDLSIGTDLNEFDINTRTFRGNGTRIPRIPINTNTTNTSSININSVRRPIGLDPGSFPEPTDPNSIFERPDFNQFPEPTDPNSIFGRPDRTQIGLDPGSFPEPTDPNSIFGRLDFNQFAEEFDVNTGFRIFPTSYARSSSIDPGNGMSPNDFRGGVFE